MTILPIQVYPAPCLKKKTQEIENPKDPQIQELILDMIETMKENNGMGLAAPQVGKSLRLCVIKFERKTYVLINPKFKSKSWSKEICEEGCLSFPGQFLPIKRSKKVKVIAKNKAGKEIEIKAEGLLARALQHEIDHLDGILYIERS
ncbi:MAG: peptide deformylase [Candidatus Moraniibacteriota bacterium]